MNYCFHFQYCARHRLSAAALFDEQTGCKYHKTVTFMSLFFFSTFFHYENHKIIKHLNFLFHIWIFLHVCIHFQQIHSRLYSNMEVLLSLYCPLVPSNLFLLLKRAGARARKTQIHLLRVQCTHIKLFINLCHKVIFFTNLGTCQTMNARRHLSFACTFQQPTFELVERRENRKQKPKE